MTNSHAPRVTISPIAMKRWSAYRIVDLALFPGKEFQPIILLGILSLKTPHKALHAIVSVSKSEQLHQILVDGHGVSPQPQLFLNPLPMRLTGATSMLRQVFLWSRWPGWGILTRLNP
jgi:hypothetical protein